MEKEIKIIPPDGFEIDKEKSTFEKIVFKKIKKDLSYKDIANNFFNHKDYFCIRSSGDILFLEGSLDASEDPNNSSTKEQLESILALNKLCNVAKYLNDDWIPEFGAKQHFYLTIDMDKNVRASNTSCQGGLPVSNNVYFKTLELAKQAIEILGEEEVRKALTLNW